MKLHFIYFLLVYIILKNLTVSVFFRLSKKPYDPIDYNSIDATEFWIMEKDEEGELDHDELEKMVVRI